VQVLDDAVCRLTAIIKYIGLWQFAALAPMQRISDIFLCRTLFL
jgi:hypothetical protein